MGKIISLVCSAFAFSAMTSVAQAEPTAMKQSEPMRLAAQQMDAVSAGTVAVGVFSSATADGSNAYASSSTSTTVFSTPTGTVEIGLGFGGAVACCGSDTYTDVQTSYYAEGDKVIAHSTVNDTSTPRFSFSNGVTTVIAVDVPSR